MTQTTSITFSLFDAYKNGNILEKLCQFRYQGFVAEGDTNCQHITILNLTNTTTHLQDISQLCQQEKTTPLKAIQ